MRSSKYVEKQFFIVLYLDIRWVFCSCNIGRKNIKIQRNLYIPCIVLETWDLEDVKISMLKVVQLSDEKIGASTVGSGIEA